jgi:phenol 2-monooxygenase
MRHNIWHSNYPRSLKVCRVFETFGGFTSGISIRYNPSIIVDPVHQLHAKNLIVGKRVPPQILIRAADSRPFELQELLPSDVRFKVLIFAGDTSLPSQRAKLDTLAVEMNAADGFLRSLPLHGKISDAFDIIAIASAKNAVVRHTDVPELFRSHWSKSVFTLPPF